MADQLTAAGLRELADWMEAHPDVLIPKDSITIYATDSDRVAKQTLLALAPYEKTYTNDLFYLKRMFGGIELRFCFLRSVVCTKRVVGVEKVPELYIPGRVIEAHDREIVEWDCHPILSEDADAST